LSFCCTLYDQFRVSQGCHQTLELGGFIFANLMNRLVEMGYIRLILPNSTSCYIIFSKLKPLETTKIISFRHANDHTSINNQISFGFD